MIITAKFRSICPACNNEIYAGARVSWSRGSKAKHVTCTNSKEAIATRDLAAAQSAWNAAHRSEETEPIKLNFYYGSQLIHKTGRCEDAPCCGCCE